MRAARIVPVLTSTLLLASCSANHGALNPAGPRARHIADLMLVFFSVATIVYLIVIAVLVWAMLRRRSEASRQGGAVLEAAEKKASKIIAASVALTVVTLITLALADFFVQRSLQSHPEDALRIVVTGHQYWWEVEYDDPAPSQRLRTANEIHIPLHRPVELVLTSRDVIHSFWLPSIMGKKDLIPGYTNTEVLVAERPGVFRGQCAEFCGLQHAQMRLVVHVDPPDRFEQWRQQQLTPARAPSNDTESKGQQVFLNSTCVLCHAIQGTPAGSNVGPDLTHLASRGTLAAGALPNTPTNLASWILSPHRFKPGVMMPATGLPAQDLSALTAYLGSLQ
jgi:cytochrome c oxidase subunit 2